MSEPCRTCGAEEPEFHQLTELCVHASPGVWEPVHGGFAALCRSCIGDYGPAGLPDTSSDGRIMAIRRTVTAAYRRFPLRRRESPETRFRVLDVVDSDVAAVTAEDLERFREMEDRLYQKVRNELNRLVFKLRPSSPPEKP